MRREAREEARRWLIQAQDEFRNANELRLRGRFYLALFHFQQATEKALKAFLYTVAGSEEVFLTHSIYELIRWAKEAAPDFGKVEKAVRLDQYYIPTRYPTGLPGGVPSRFYADPAHARPATNDEMRTALVHAWNDIKSPLGYAPIVDTALLGSIYALTEQGVHFEIATARQSLRDWQRESPTAVRFSVDRMGNMAHVRLLNSQGLCCSPLEDY